MTKSLPWRSIGVGSIAALAVVELWGLVALPLQGYDSPYHLFWIEQWHAMWQEGIFFPRWLPGSFNGLGAPTFYFYGPVSYIASSILFSLFASLTSVIVFKLIALIALVASGASMWMYLRWRGVSTFFTAFATSVYCVAPYRYFDYSVRSALSEHVAFIFVPLVFWGIERLRAANRQEVYKGFLLLAFATAGLLLTNFAAFVTTMLGAAVFVIASAPNTRQLLWLVASLTAGALLAAVQIIPTLWLSSDIQLGQLWVAPSVIESSPIASILFGTAYTTNAYNLLGFLAMALLLFAAFQSQRTPVIRFILWTCALILFLDLPYVSRVAFNFVPVFKIIQRPERLGILVTLMLALWIGSEDTKKTFERWSASLLSVWAVGVIALISISAVGFHIHKFGPPPIGETPGFATKWSRVTQDASSSTYANFADTFVWTSIRNGNIRNVTRTAYEDRASYSSQEPMQLTFRRHYWPTWQATLDGGAIMLSADSLGRATLTAPAGEHRVALHYEEPLVAAIGMWISVITLSVLLIGVAIAFRQSASRSLPAQ